METAGLKDSYGKLFFLFFIIIAFSLWLRVDLAISNYNSDYVALSHQVYSQSASGSGVDIIDLPQLIYDTAGTSRQIILSGIIGLLSVLVMYYFALRIANNKSVAFFAALLLLITGSHIVFSTLFTDVILNALFLTGALYFGTLAYESKKYSFNHLLAAVLYLFAAFSDYSLILLSPLFIAAFFMKNKKEGLLALILLSPALVFFFIHPAQLSVLTGQTGALGTNITKNINRSVLHLLLPAVLMFAANSYLFRLGISKKKYYFLAAGGFIMAVLSVLNSDDIAKYTFIAYSLIFIIPGSALLLKQFSFMDKNFKNAVIMIVFAMAALTYYQMKF